MKPLNKGDLIYQKLVCFQCKQTANLQDLLIAKVIALAVSSGNHSTADVQKLIIDSLFVPVTNVNFDDTAIKSWCDRVDQVRKIYGSTQQMNMKTLWTENEDICSLKTLILFGLKGMAAYDHHAATLGYRSEEVDQFLRKVWQTSLVKNQKKIY